MHTHIYNADTHISAYTFYVESLQLLQGSSYIYVLHWFPWGCFTAEAESKI